MIAPFDRVPTLRRPALVAVAALSLSLLAACSDFKRAIGWERDSPDEFQTVQHAPLSQPPDFYLRPPTPGAPRPQDAVPVNQAQALLDGAPVNPNATAGLTTGEAALLTQAGANNAPPDIRAQVDAATTALVQSSPSFVDKLMFWRSPQPAGQVIDPNAEAARLRQEAANPPTITRSN